MNATQMAPLAIWNEDDGLSTELCNKKPDGVHIQACDWEGCPFSGMNAMAA